MSSAPLRRWEYCDTDLKIAERTPTLDEPALLAQAPAPRPGLSEEQVAERVTSALDQAERRWKAQAEQQQNEYRNQINAVLQAFADERARYFHDAETEVVHLALAVARKILGREATLDPELIMAMVRIALDRMGAGPAVKLHVSLDEVDLWKASRHFAGSAYRCDVIGEPSLASGECRVTTDLGGADFGLEAQFKNIEQGMLDLLRLRPPLATRHAE